jgi:hypothetical protein
MKSNGSILIVRNLSAYNYVAVSFWFDSTTPRDDFLDLVGLLVGVKAISVIGDVVSCARIRAPKVSV